MSPLNRGAGNRPGHPIATCCPRLPIVSKCPDPPPDNTTGVTAARGRILPSAPFTNVASGFTHPFPRRTRTGTACCSSVFVPSGFANTDPVSDRNPSTSTRFPVSRARVVAVPIGERSPAAVSSAAGASGPAPAPTADTVAIGHNNPAAATPAVKAPHRICDHLTVKTPRKQAGRGTAAPSSMSYVRNRRRASSRVDPNDARRGVWRRS
ncbi:hypothetical protein GCM10009534_58880 [Kribbella sandramycini]